MSLPIGGFISQNDQNPQLFKVFPEAIRRRIGGSVALAERVLTPDTLAAASTEEIAYLFSTWGMPALEEECIQKNFPNLKAVFYGAGSVQGFARPFLRCGVRVFSAWGANAVPVAEYTLAQVLLANKGFYQAQRRYRRDGDFRGANAYAARQPGNYRARVGILGAGMIGRLVLSLLQPYAIEPLVFDAFLAEDEIHALGARKADLDTVFSTCHVISNHIGNNPKTERMLRYEHFSRMLPNATFINTGRGQQVVEDDLIRALREEPERTAVLDVTYPEPVAAGSPLLSMDNVVITPHIAGSMSQEVERMGLYMAEELEALLQGRAVRFEVTEKMLETMA